MASTHNTSVTTITSAIHNPSCCNDSCSNNHSSSTRKLYRGVRKRKWGKWISEIRLPNSRDRIWLGSYETQEKAARAFDAALYILRGTCWEVSPTSPTSLSREWFKYLLGYSSHCQLVLRWNLNSTNTSFNFPDTPLNMEINNNVAIPRDHFLSPREIQEVAAKFANYTTHTPLLETREEEEPSSESQSGADSFGLFESKTTSSPTVYDYDGTIGQVDHGEMDWTFLNMLDDDNMYSGELLYYTQPPAFEDNGDEIEGGDAFSNHSILWGWDF